MRLVKLYSNNSLFHTVKFNRGLNLVMGKITNASDLNKDSHNLGKTSLVKLIDFMLLCETDSDFFLKKSKKFDEDIFYLEIETNDGVFVTIRRSIDDMNKISLKTHKEKELDCRLIDKWDYVNLSLKSKDPEKNPKAILDKLFKIEVNGKKCEYRKILSYFLRSQDDYMDLFRLTKNKGKDVFWKPILLENLGFDSIPMVKKYELEQDIINSEKAKTVLEKNFSDDLNKSSIKNKLAILNNNLIIKKQELDALDFNSFDNEKIMQLVEEINKEIVANNREKYTLISEIELINQSLESKTVYDFDETKNVFEEFKIYFKEEIVKDYESLIEFNNKLTSERIKYLLSIKKDKENKLNKINEKISFLYNEQSQLSSDINQLDLIKKVNSLNKDIIKIQNDIFNFEKDLEYADQVKQFDIRINRMKAQIPLLVNDIQASISKENVILTKIQCIFSDLIKSIINKNAMLYVKLNSKNNIDFKTEITEDLEVTQLTSGNTYKKIMCACFDLSLLISNIEKNYIRFVYHDGVLESLELRKRKTYFKTICEICNKYDIQYIFSAIDGDIYHEFSSYDLCCVELNDSIDGKGRLFGRDF